jgi:hypothetical protein
MKIVTRSALIISAAALFSGCGVLPLSLSKGQDDTLSPSGTTFRYTGERQLTTMQKAQMKIGLFNAGTVPIVYLETTNCPKWPMLPFIGNLDPNQLERTRQDKGSCFKKSGQFARYNLGNPTMPPTQCSIEALDASGTIQFSLHTHGLYTDCKVMQTGPRSGVLVWKLRQQ